MEHRNGEFLKTQINYKKQAEYKKNKMTDTEYQINKDLLESTIKMPA